MLYVSVASHPHRILRERVLTPSTDLCLKRIQIHLQRIEKHHAAAARLLSVEKTFSFHFQHKNGAKVDWLMCVFFNTFSFVLLNYACGTFLCWCNAAYIYLLHFMPLSSLNFNRLLFYLFLFSHTYIWCRLLSYASILPLLVQIIRNNIAIIHRLLRSEFFFELGYYALNNHHYCDIL